MMKVSVIIPVYNTPELFLRECLESVIKQSLKEIEILCIDDQSTDQSLDILKEYARKDSRVRVIRQEKNGRVARARNRGAQEATGAYLYFMDCDDFIQENALEIAYQVSVERNLDMLLFSGEMFYETEALKRRFLMEERYLKYNNPEKPVMTGGEMYRYLREEKRYYNTIWIQLHKTSFFREKAYAFCPQAGTCDDALFTFQAINQANRIACIPEVLYHYRIRENSGDTKAKESIYIKGITHWYTQMLLIFLDWDLPKEDWTCYREHFQLVRNLIGELYWEVYETGSQKIKETLHTLECMLFHEPITFSTVADFMDHPDPQRKYCIFGAGIMGKRVLVMLQEKNYPLPLGICDNDPSLQGTELFGVPILSFEEALKRYEDLHILIANHNYKEEIYGQVSEKLAKDHISTLFM